MSIHVCCSTQQAVCLGLTFSRVLEQFVFTEKLDALLGVHVELLPPNGELFLLLVSFAGRTQETQWLGGVVQRRTGESKRYARWTFEMSLL